MGLFATKKPFHFGRVGFQNEKFLVQTIFLDLPVQGSETDTQQSCRFRFITGGMLQYFADMLLFHFGQFKGSCFMISRVL